MGALRERARERPDRIRRQVRARRIVRVAEDHNAGAIGDGAEQRVHVHAAALEIDRDRPPARALRHQRVQRVGGPGRDELVARSEQDERGCLQELGRAVADHDLLGLHAVPLAEQPAHGARVAVRIAVHAPARRVNRGVHDLRVREVRPLRAREVDHRHLGQRQRALARPPGPQLAVDLLLIDVFELPVVVEEPHVERRG